MTKDDKTYDHAAALRSAAKSYDERASLALTVDEADGLDKTAATLRFVAVLHDEGIVHDEVAYAFAHAARQLLASPLTTEPPC